MSVAAILKALKKQLQRHPHEDPNRNKQVESHLQRLTSFIETVSALGLCDLELALLKAVVLFSPDWLVASVGKWKSQVELYQFRAVNELKR